jgi:serine protease inhibitor
MSSSRALRGCLVASVLLSVISCGGLPSEPGGMPARLDALPRPLSDGEQAIVAAANDFSFSLFRTVNAAQRDANVFISPLSASMALGMTMNGAAGATYDQMRRALAFGDAGAGDINAGYKSLIALLRGLDPQVDVRIANSIWYREGFPVEPSFVEASRNYFDAEVGALDFSKPAALTTINSWVSGATAGHIPTILDRIDRDLVMLLINAIYFKGSWREKFDPALTREAPFHGVDGDRPAMLMHREGTMGYLATADFTAVDLPYGNSAFTMTVVLPQPGRNVEDVVATLRSAQWTDWAQQLREVQVDLFLPRFRLAWERTLNEDLEALGMRDAFVDGGADFSRLSPLGRQVFISFVKQKTYVDVDEEGTEAAAVTAVGAAVTSMPQTVVLRVDRPFIFVIRERLSGTVMFLGKVVGVP